MKLNSIALYADHSMGVPGKPVGVLWGRYAVNVIIEVDASEPWDVILVRDMEEFPTGFEYVGTVREEDDGPSQHLLRRQQPKLQEVRCARARRGELHRPHIWTFQPEDDSPATINAWCDGDSVRL